MRYVIAHPNRPIFLGRKGENGVTTVRFPLFSIFPSLGEAEYTLNYQRSIDEAPYSCAFEIHDGFLDWLVLQEDLEKPGSGVAQIIATIDEAQAKSDIFSTEAKESLS